MGDLSVVDYGCGSGVLGIAALLLGAARVLSVDHDPQARLATVENAAHNGIDVESGRMVVLAPADVEVARHDVVLANILADPLVALSRTLTSLVRPGGRILLSGLRLAQRDRVVHAYPGFRFEPSDLRDGWVALEGTRSSE
jgi:ribosomal protein L11 methyltransferase